jgi:hypothetical protein
MKTHRLLALASGLLLGTGILAVAGSAQAASTAEVSILHGVPAQQWMSTPTAKLC